LTIISYITFARDSRKYFINVFCQEITATNSISRIDIYAVAQGYLELAYIDEYPWVNVNIEKPPAKKKPVLSLVK